MISLKSDDVIYIQCPYCKKGWFGRVLKTEINYDYENPRVEKFIIEGINPTDITKDIMCLNCGNHYTPIEKVEYDIKEGLIAVSSPEGMNIKNMPEFVAKALVTCKGK